MVPHHHIQKRYLCHPSMLVFVHLHDLLCIRPDGDEHPPRTGKLLDERRGKCGSSCPDVDHVERALFGNPCDTNIESARSTSVQRLCAMHAAALTLPAVARDHLDPAVLDGVPEPILAEVPDRPLDELGDVVDPDDFALFAPLVRLVLQHPVEHRTEVARARADVKHARPGLEERQEVLRGMGMLQPETLRWC